MMEGGNDGLNTVVPTGESRYYALRPGLAIPAASALPLARRCRPPPRPAKLKARYDQGDVAIVQGVGYANPDLSHFTSMGIWMNGWGGGSQPGGPTGWVGRYLDGLPNAASESLYGAVIGTSVPLHMVGAVARASGLPQNIGGAFGIDRRDPNDVRMFDALAAFSGAASGLGQWGDLAAKVEHDTLELSQRIQPAYQGTFPNSDLGRQLTLVARLINANLGVRVFNTSIGGLRHPLGPGRRPRRSSSASIDGAIDAFFATLDPSWRNRVTLMTFSEFGRRPERNDDQRHRPRDGRADVPGRPAGEGRALRQPPSLTTDLDRDGNLKYHVDFRQVYAIGARHVAQRRLPAGARIHIPEPRSLRRWPRRGTRPTVRPKRRRRLRLTS